MKRSFYIPPRRSDSVSYQWSWSEKPQADVRARYISKFNVALRSLPSVGLFSFLSHIFPFTLFFHLFLPFSSPIFSLPTFLHPSSPIFSFLISFSPSSPCPPSSPFLFLLLNMSVCSKQTLKWPRTEGRERCVLVSIQLTCKFQVTTSLRSYEPFFYLKAALCTRHLAVFVRTFINISGFPRVFRKYY